MATRFIACTGCARHVREGECVCPFCGAKAPCAKPLRRIAGGLSRSAMRAAGAAGVVVGLGDCSAEQGTPVYGIACDDTCTTSVYDAGDESVERDSTIGVSDVEAESTADAAVDGAADATGEPEPSDGAVDAPSDTTVDGHADGSSGD